MNMRERAPQKYALNQKSKFPPPNICSNISKSILPILIIQTVMDRD